MNKKETYSNSKNKILLKELFEKDKDKVDKKEVDKNERIRD
jgi:hypothetical protein